MEREKKFTSVTFSVLPDRCTVENPRQFDQISFHIDYCIGQHPESLIASAGIAALEQTVL
jgi:hypothetical protein